MAIDVATLAKVLRHTKTGKALNKLSDIATLITGKSEYPKPTPVEERLATVTWTGDSNGSFVPDTTGWDVSRYNEWLHSLPNVFYEEEVHQA